MCAVLYQLVSQLSQINNNRNELLPTVSDKVLLYTKIYEGTFEVDTGIPMVIIIEMKFI